LISFLLIVTFLLTGCIWPNNLPWFKPAINLTIKSSSVVMQGVHLPVSVKVTTSSGQAPSGEVDIFFSKGVGCIGLTLDHEGSVTCRVSTSDLPLGVNLITARYSGDPNYRTSLSIKKLEIIPFVIRTPTIVFDPSTPDSLTVGGPARLSVTVTGLPGLVPIGGLDFTTNHGGACLGLALDAQGKGSCHITADLSPPGPLQITATYKGSSQYYQASATHHITVEKSTPTVEILDFQGPPYPIPGNNFLCTIRVTGASPTGSVALFANKIKRDTVTLAGGGNTQTINMNCGIMAAGINTIIAEYSGDQNNTSAKSERFDFKVFFYQLIMLRSPIKH
jgi:hypothetical protein